MSVARDPEILLTSHDLAKRWSMTVPAVQAMRRRGNGPPFVKLGAKRVRYRLSDIVAFEQTFLTLSEARADDPEAEAKAAKQRERFNRVRPMAMRKRLAAAAKRRAAKRA
jgi:hypothetical protein